MTRLPAFALGFFLAAFMFAVPIARAERALPAPLLRVEQLPTAKEAEPTPAPVRPQAAINPSTAIGILGLPNAVECWNCAPFTAVAHISHYNPPAGGPNCYDFDLDNSYCYSPTFIGVHWKAVWGLGAACPVEWKIGTWVVIPDVGAFICLDRGGGIICDPDTKVCNVDILGPSGPWDGKTLTVSLWVPLDPPRGE